MLAKEYETIAVPLDAVCEGAAETLSKSNPCCPDRIPQLVEDSWPCGAFPFLIKRSVPQTDSCHVAVNAFQVPPGHDAVLKQIAAVERYPGTLYGAHFFLLVNGIIHPWFNRLDFNIGSLSHPMQTHLCLKERDLVSVMIQCAWIPFSFPGQENYIQTIYPFLFSGYFIQTAYFPGNDILEL